MDFKLEQLTQPERWLELGLPVLLKIAVAFLIFFLGRFVVRMAVKVLRSVMQRANADPTLTGFLGNVVYGLGYALVVISALGQIGINTNSLAAVVGGAALAVGLALQGQLSAFAAGVLLILFRPFRVGDFVDAGGIKGTVEEIKIIHTVLRTADNQEVIVPNNTITAGDHHQLQRPQYAPPRYHHRHRLRRRSEAGEIDPSGDRAQSSKSAEVTGAHRAGAWARRQFGRLRRLAVGEDRGMG